MTEERKEFVVNTTSRKQTPLDYGAPITFTPEERLHFRNVHGVFDVSLLHKKMAEKVMILVSRYSEEADVQPQNLFLRSFTMKKVPQRYRGKRSPEYHIIRLEYGYGKNKKKAAFRFLRTSEDSFDGKIFNHLPRRRSHA